MALEIIKLDRGCNTARFIAGRQPAKRDNGRTDSRLMFDGVQFAYREGNHLPQGFEVGVPLGPLDAALEHEQGTRIIPVKVETVQDLKKFKFRTRQIKQENVVLDTRYYLNYGTFRNDSAGILNAIPYDELETDAAYIEVWTGHLRNDMQTLIALKSGLHQHGSVEWDGSEMLVNEIRFSSGSTETIEQGKAADHQVAGRKTLATLMGEQHGPSIGGTPLWTVRLWKLRFSPTDSERIVVRQMDRFFVVFIRDGRPAYAELNADSFRDKFIERAALADAASAPTATANAVVAA